MFLAKKWLGSLLLPLPLLLLLAGIGCLLLVAQKRRSGAGLLGLALLSLLLLSTRPVANALIRPLETQYPPYQVKEHELTSAELEVKHIIVLGAAQVADPRLPLLSQLGHAGLSRISEGVRLAHAYPEARLIVSGYAGGEGRSSAELYSLVAQELGIDATRLALVPEPKDTAEEAAAIAPMIDSEPTLLVTSASHMPRSIALFQAQGAQPIAAPVGHHAKETAGSLPLYSYLPKAHYLERSEIAWHEYLGSAWHWLTGQNTGKTAP